MGVFLNNPSYTPYEDGSGKWSLEGTLRYQLDAAEVAKYGQLEIRVPAKFDTDFASVPRIFWFIIAPTGTYDRAAVLHDWLYRTHGLNGRLTRKQCDQILRDGMGACHTGKIWSEIIYLSVRWFGWLAWNNEPVKGDF